MDISVQPTPNPRTVKFLPGMKVSEVPVDFVTAPANDTLLQEIFDVYGVTGVHFGDVFVSVTVEDADLWDEARPLIMIALENGLQKFEAHKFFSDNAGNAASEDDSEITVRIKEVIENYVRPSVANDGGDIVFGSFDQKTGLLKLSMRGACSGCPSSSATLQMGIQNLMNHFVPEVLEIESF